MKVCIIGSGLGGLTCGVILAKNGFEVTVLEQGAQAGGCLQCFSRGGARFETGMHFIGSAAEGQSMDRIMDYLGLKADVSLSQLDPTGYEVVGLCGQQFRFANGREAFIEQMASYFPRQKDNLYRYFDAVERVSSASALLNQCPKAPPSAPEGATIGSLLNGKTIEAPSGAVGGALRSIDSVIDELITDPLLAKVLVGNLPLYAAERGKTPFATHAFVTDFYNQSAFRIVGGSDAIARSLVGTIECYGGHVFTRQRAVKIVCDDSRATGVETATGDYYAADFVISGIHPMRTLELTDSHLIRPAFRRRVNAMEQTVGVFAVYLHFREGCVPYMNHNYYGYNTDTPWGCEHYDEQSWPKGFLYMHFCEAPPSAPEGATIDSPLNGKTIVAPPGAEGGASGASGASPLKFARTGVVLSYMQWDDVAAWAGTTVGHRGQDYEDFKRRKAQKLLESLEKHFPGITSNIAHYYTSTPLTYRDYTGTERGSMYGIAKDIGLGPAGRIPHRTKIPNLFQTGQNINSHGMQGVLVGTMVTCNELLQRP